MCEPAWCLKADIEVWGYLDITDVTSFVYTVVQTSCARPCPWTYCMTTKVDPSLFATMIWRRLGHAHCADGRRSPFATASFSAV